jgi:hypothetical protein
MRLITKISTSILFAALFIGSVALNAVAQEAVIGQVNWEDGYIRAIGVGTAQSSGNKALDLMSATRAATVIGQRALLETIKGVRIDSTTRVENMMLKEDVIQSQVSGIIQGAQVVKTSSEWVGEAPMVTVEIRICLNLDQCNGRPLVAVLGLEGRGEPPHAPQRIFPPTPSPQQIQAAAKPSPGEPPPPATPAKRQERAKIQPSDPNKPVTGLILNLEGHPFERELLPIVATKGEDNQYLTVYSVKLVEPKIIRTKGVVRYQTSVDQAKKHPLAGENFLVVPVENITKENMIIISLDAAKIISETNRYGNNYLSEGKVVIADR